MGFCNTSESAKVLLLIEGLASQETSWGSTFFSVSHKADPAPPRSEVAPWAQGGWPFQAVESELTSPLLPARAEPL